jgi:hypothetical protein
VFFTAGTGAGVVHKQSIFEPGEPQCANACGFFHGGFQMLNVRTLIPLLLLMTAPALAGTPYDGVWDVTIETKAGSCESSAQYHLTVQDGKFSGPADIAGTVAHEGMVKATLNGAYAFANHIAADRLRSVGTDKRRDGCFRPRDHMPQTSKLNFERAAREFAQWRAVPETERSPAPAWWWQPAFELRNLQEVMIPLWCYRLELPLSSTYAAGAAVLLATLSDQTSLPWPDEFPRKIEGDDEEEKPQRQAT